MSTKKIRAAMLSHGLTHDVSEALAELEAIEKACRTLAAESIGDRVYDVRNMAAFDASFTGNAWEHPRVVAYGEAAQIITNIAKESKA